MSTVPPRSLSRADRWLIVLLLMGFAAFGHFNRIGISVAGTEIFIVGAQKTDSSRPDAETPDTSSQTFAKSLRESDMGWVYSTFLLVYTIAMMPGGWLIDRIGAVWALTLLGVTMGSFVALTGILGWVVSTPAQFWIGLIVVRSLAGLCSAPLHPGAAHVVAEITPETGRSTGNGFVIAGALLGIAFCYPLFGKLMELVTWQGAFVISGVGMICYGTIWHALASRRVRSIPSAAHADEATSATGERDWIRVLARKDLWLITLSFVAYGYFQYLFFYWMQNYFEKTLHVSAAESRQASFIITLAQGAGMALGGLGTDAVCRVMGLARGRRAIVFTALSLSALFGVIAVVLKDYTQVVVFMALAMGAQGMCENIFWTMTAEIGGKSRGFALGFLNTGGNAGGIFSPVVSPYMAAAIGWPLTIVVACAALAGGGLIWLWINPASAAKPAAAPA